MDAGATPEVPEVIVRAVCGLRVRMNVTHTANSLPFAAPRVFHERPDRAAPSAGHLPAQARVRDLPELGHGVGAVAPAGSW
jgi:hypothetical protein